MNSPPSSSHQRYKNEWLETIQWYGFIVDTLSHIATCWHVVSQADEITVQLPFTEPWEYQVFKIFEANDLALLESIEPLSTDTPKALLHPDW